MIRKEVRHGGAATTAPRASWRSAHIRNRLNRGGGNEMKNRIALLLLLLIVPFFFTACPRRPVFTLYNNTGTDLAVLVAGRRIEWQAGKAFRISHEAGSSVRWSDLEIGYDPERQVKADVLVVESGETVRRYRLALPPLPAEYRDTQPGVWRRFLQLQPDGRLYAVKVGATFPVDSLSPQPAGMPLEPIVPERPEIPRRS